MKIARFAYIKTDKELWVDSIVNGSFNYISFEKSMAPEFRKIMDVVGTDTSVMNLLKEHISESV